MGVYDKRWVTTHCEVLKELGSNNVMVVHGEDGLDEITLSKNTHICELKNKRIVEGYSKLNLSKREQDIALTLHKEIERAIKKNLICTI